MAEFNSDFWEIPIGSDYLENLSAERAVWFETDDDRERRYVFEDFFQEVRPVVMQLIDTQLTQRQREVITLYYVYGKTQQDIAVILDLAQSTVSRHLFGTVRQGRKVGGAIPKLRKVIERAKSAQIDSALDTLQARLAEVA